MNITLIGMPGSGKSFIGKKLAEQLGYECIELDIVMEKEHNLRLQEILENLGDEAFLAEQANDAIARTEGKDGLVISPGGSIVYSENAMTHLKTISEIVYLETSFETIMKRVALVPRGIVGLGEKTLEELYAERTTLYKKWADVIVDGEKEPEVLLNEISNIR
jgi:shikimate kinase